MLLHYEYCYLLVITNGFKRYIKPISRHAYTTLDLNEDYTIVGHGLESNVFLRSGNAIKENETKNRLRFKRKLLLALSVNDRRVEREILACHKDE